MTPEEEARALATDHYAAEVLRCHEAGDRQSWPHDIRDVGYSVGGNDVR